MTGQVRLATAVPLRTRLGGAGLALAIAVFVVVFVVSVRQPGTAYVWPHSMISDLGDPTCGVRGGRWICAPGHAWFNAGLIATGSLLVASALALAPVWGRILSGGVVLMGVGLVVAGVFPAGDTGALHLAGVVLVMVPPGLGLMVSGIRPEVAWLRTHRVPRGLLGGLALVLAAESRLPGAVVPAGAGEVAMVGCLLVALVGESARLLTGARGVRPPVNR